MERAILGIVLIVALVGVIGLFSRYDFASSQDALASVSPTGNVVASQSSATATQSCDSCAGFSPVCAKMDNIYMTFPNACEARCAGGVVAAQYSCAQIPRN